MGNQCMKIENEFVDYNTALALKKLGFDEPCILLYRGLDTQPVCQIGYDFKTEKNSNYNDVTNYWLTVPLFSQVFKWFREKYNLDSSISLVGNGYGFYIHKNRNYTNKGENYGMYITYKEAELKCLKKLIEIINENKEN